MNIDLANKIALVTGGSSGIGLAVAEGLAREGMHVWLLARDPVRLEQALTQVNSCRKTHDQHCGCVMADLSNQKQAEDAVQQVIHQAGLPDVVINSAGQAHPGYFQHLDMQIFHCMMDVNYFGTLYVTRAVVPGMIERRSGIIVNVGSMAGALGIFGYTAYGASKFAVRGFSEALRMELKPYNIQVCLAYPPDTDTPQLAYENQFKPIETRAIAGNAGLLTPQAVAKQIISGIKRGRFLIVIGMESKLVYLLNSLAGSLLHPMLDYMVSQAQKKQAAMEKHNQPD